MHRNPVMDVWMSQINCQCSLLFSYSYVCKYSVCVCVCVSPALTQFTQLGNYILQMAASQREGAKVTGGKYYCSTDLCLKVFWVSVLQPWPRRTSSASSKSPLTSAHTMMTESLLRHLQVFCVSASKITATTTTKKLFPTPPPQLVKTPKCLFEEMWERIVFSQRAEIPAVFPFDHAPVPSIPPQIHIKVSPPKETLAKYILKRSVASLSCWTGGEGRVRWRRLISASDRTWRFIWICDIFQESKSVTDAQAAMLTSTEDRLMILTWHRFNELSLTGSLQRAPLTPSAGKSWLSFSTHPRSER